MSVESGKIFNVADVEGIDAVSAQTTAAQAQAEAPTSAAARSIEKNADIAQDAAQSAALAAKSLGKEFTGEPPSAADQFQKEASAATNIAVAEGKQDVAAAAETGNTYLEQAKNLASSALASAQAYLPGTGTANANTRGPSTGTTGTSDVVGQIQTGAQQALATGKEYLASAQSAAQPHIDRVSEAAQPHINRVSEAAQPHINRVSEAASNYVNNLNGQTDTSNATPSSVPATSAPLESGPHTVETPYPPTSTTVGSNAPGA